MRLRSLILPIIATAVVATILFRMSYGYFQSEELTKAQGRLSLYQSSVSGELERFSHLTYVLARDPFVIETAKGGSTDRLNPRIKDFAARAGLDAIYLIDPDGLTIAASNYQEPSSFIGQNYAFRPYFQDALSGAQGRFYAIGATTGLPGYFIADAVHDVSGQMLGVLAIKINLTGLEENWIGSGERVFLANKDGVVLLASEPSWRYRVLSPLSPDRRQEIVDARQFSGQDLALLDWSVLADQRARIGGSEHLHLVADDLPHGWQLHFFASDVQASTRAWLVTAIAMILAAVAFILFQIQRARRVDAELRRSEREEAELRQANERLATEITERMTAERRLKRTQNELESASRLAALGRLAASVTHELGQPIAAMRNHLVAAEIGGGGGGKLTTDIGGLVDRMEGITRQLKFFASSDAEAFKQLDLRDAIKMSLDLVAPNIQQIGAEVALDLPTHPVLIRGIRLRVEQVMTNLLRNALDASEDRAAPKLTVRAGVSGTDAWVEIEDNGHGIGSATLEDLKEPFVTTRESGRGMGLGLAISASIVKDHEGQMTARNVDPEGAVFRVTFPHAPLDEDQI
ncbi:sensor histidine kinase [Aliiroseovarius marinus]|uniref:sensor histidine kinase n=1 Tax=Aliiroseovarius marinus TaxID=2500159 RepID=UPI00249472F0|nr:ATP-binding protein [Aliiroseovarius marinus]